MGLENGEGNGMVMPVQPMGYGGYGGYGYPVMPMYGGYGGYGGFGGGFGNMFGMDGAWIILLLLLCGGGWGGLGGMLGGFGLGGWGMDGVFPWLLASNANNQNATQDGFNQAATANTLSGIQNTMTNGFGDTQLGIAGVNQNICQTGGQIQNALCSGFAGTTAAVTGAQNAITQQLYNNEINSLNRSFAEQTANTQGFNSVQGQLAQCCCDNRLETVQTQGIVQSEAAATRAANAANTQAILDKLCALELDGVKSDLAAAQRENVALQNQLNMAAARADNVAQTAALIQDNNGQTAALIQRIAPYPVPAFPVGNPYGYNGYGYNGYGYGCNNCGCGNN